jgi:uncharacterized protein YjeT (DUF2065 family)
MWLSLIRHWLGYTHRLAQGWRELICFICKGNKMKKWIATMQEIPNTHLRVMGFVAMGLGLVLTYFFRE